MKKRREKNQESTKKVRKNEKEKNITPKMGETEKN